MSVLQSDSQTGRSSDSNRITRVYTGVGDDGMSCLVGGAKVAKNDPHFEAFGMVDELSVFIGHLREQLVAAGDVPDGTSRAFFANVGEHLVYIQHLLLNLGGRLATPPDVYLEGMPTIEDRHVKYLEELIDHINGSLPPLKDFLLPGGHPLVTAAHFCRVICRRTERVIAHLAEQTPVEREGRVFINRLSDFFFVLGRAMDEELRRDGISGAETIWQRDIKPPTLPRL